MKIAKPRVIAIVGPTSSGKSDLAVLLAEKIKGLYRAKGTIDRTSYSEILGEVISADSRQVYRGLDIATGKITPREMRGVPHHLLDVADPKKIYSVADFKKDATIAIDDITSRGKIPIVCGGTGFYIDALLLGQEFPEVLPDKKLRDSLEKQSAEKLFDQLKKLDPRRAKEIDRHNRVRLIRAIEIAKTIGNVPKQNNVVPYDVTWIGIKPNPEELKKRIHNRLMARMKKGMIAEAKRLHENGLSYKRMRELGLEYKYLADFLQNKISKEELLEKIEKGDLDYAKRQMTWFKRNKEIRWIESKDTHKILRHIKTSL